MNDYNVQQNNIDFKLIGERFSSAVEDVINTMAGFEIFALPAEDMHEVQVDSDKISGAMMLLGQCNSMVAITIPREAASTIVSYMTGISTSALKEEELYDGVAELVNMVCGRVKAWMSGTQYHFQLTSPFVIAGNLKAIIHKSKVARLEKRFRGGDIQIELKVFFV